MKQRVVRKVAEVSSVPLYVSALLLGGRGRDFQSVVDEVAATPSLFCGVIFSNALCVLFCHAALSWFRS
ncbi:MAG: hypothetical protein HY900_17530 [Deltaproteobacteria bacterium]|nr:hypothetical protein [Deltaproteobacteria bacterium]